MAFYAIQYAYGRNTDNIDGARPDLLFMFDTTRERSAWVAEGPPFQDVSGYREQIGSHDPRVSRTQRHPEYARELIAAGYCPVSR